MWDLWRLSIGSQWLTRYTPWFKVLPGLSSQTHHMGIRAVLVSDISCPTQPIVIFTALAHVHARGFPRRSPILILLQPEHALLQSSYEIRGHTALKCVMLS